MSYGFFLQLLAILIACRVVGWLGRRFAGQPQVVGEMIAGVVLGPSVFGLLLPGAQAAIFPADTRPTLYALAQFGVGLYMFTVGAALSVERLRRQARGALAVSLAGIAAPFGLAALIAPRLLAEPGLFAPGLSPLAATLFLGACIALTAFPMLARIVHERGLTDTRIGTLALGAGAVDDVCAWGILALVLALAGGDPRSAVLTIGGGAAFAFVVLRHGRRLLAPLAARVERDGRLSPGGLALLLILFCLAALVAEAIGVHAVFGGFVLGVALPRGALPAALRRAVEPLTVTLLLPIFFTYSGLATRLDLLLAPQLLWTTLIVLAASVLAKFGACAAAAALAGEDRATALGVGALMNARGLMELIIVTIGLQRGLIGPPLFAMLVLMAIVTTMMAGPLFDRVQQHADVEDQVIDSYSIRNGR